MLIYIHVPFCRSRCPYCAFHAEPLGRAKKPEPHPAVLRYVDTLLAEIGLWADRMGGHNVRTVFFGGGTPSLLPPKDIARVLDLLRATFRLERSAEITLEANPESFRTALLAHEYKKAGITRLSIGMQSLDPNMLHALGRAHKAEDCYHAYHLARDAGFANVGVDLMWGLPNQSVRHWLNTLKQLVALGPEHVSAYGLTLEPGTAFSLAYEKGALTLPNEHDLRLMYLEGAAFLEKHGYLQYEISNFSRMGYTCRHNVGYWEGEEYLGFGPSATSTVGTIRFTNPASFAAWEEKIAAGSIGGCDEQLSPLIRLVEMIMLSLRTTRGLSLDRYRAMTGHDFLTDNGRFVQALHENGLIRIRSNHLRLTVHGMLVSNSILSNLIDRTRRLLGEQLSVPQSDNVRPLVQS
ncbi:MAG: radical SAM family heme chaperone HemW [Desulfovibrionaceae bacterium]|nr:radical SAM family heme chaperone HemW [Desulfovibrionaceae bacterium]